MPLDGNFDGRGSDPLVALNTDPRAAMLSSFNGLPAKGSWTHFIADQSAGRHQHVHQGTRHGNHQGTARRCFVAGD